MGGSAAILPLNGSTGSGSGETIEKQVCVYAFVNARSGSKAGRHFVEYFKAALGQHGLEGGVMMLQEQDHTLFEQIRAALLSGKTVVALAVGGDSTTTWTLDVLRSQHISFDHNRDGPETTPVDNLYLALAPLGTGNELAHCLGWGDVFHPKRGKLVRISLSPRLYVFMCVCPFARLPFFLIFIYVFGGSSFD